MSMNNISPAPTDSVVRSVSEGDYINVSLKHPCDFCNAWSCKEVCSEALKFEQPRQREQIKLC